MYNLQYLNCIINVNKCDSVFGAFLFKSSYVLTYSLETNIHFFEYIVNMNSLCPSNGKICFC